MTPEDVLRAAGILSEGGIIVYPTDTVYGLGSRFDCEPAILKIRSIKDIPVDKPLSLAFSSISMIEEYAYIEDSNRRVLESKLPGPYTFILNKKDAVPKFVCGEWDTVGVRIPKDEFCIRLIEKIGCPIVSTSANISGRPAPCRLEDVDGDILRMASGSVNGGPCKNGRASKIIDLTDSSRVLRE